MRPEDEIWTDHPIEYYALDQFKFEPRYGYPLYTANFQPILISLSVKKLLQLTKRATGRFFVSREQPEELVCENSKIVLVGDAAHPLLVRYAFIFKIC